MQDFRLEVLEEPLGGTTLAEVAHESGKQPALLRLHLRDGKLHGKAGAIASLAHDHPAKADAAAGIDGEVPMKRAVVLVEVVLRHQGGDVATASLVSRPAELTLRGGAEIANGPGLIDHHHRIGHRVEQGLE